MAKNNNEIVYKNYLYDKKHPSQVNQYTDDDSAKPHGTYHLAGNANLYEIQRSNNFEFVVFLGDTELVQPASNPGDESAKVLDNATVQEVLRMSVSQASIPHFSQDPIEVKRGNSTLKYAGVPKFNDGTLTLNDYIGTDTKAALMAWQNKSYDVRTEKVGLADDYKKQATLIEYSPDLQVVRTWTLYGCWITGISEPDYNSDDNSKHNITVNITYDKAFLDESDGLFAESSPIQK